MKILLGMQDFVQKKMQGIIMYSGQAASVNQTHTTLYPRSCHLELQNRIFNLIIFTKPDI